MTLSLPSVSHYLFNAIFRTFFLSCFLLAAAQGGYAQHFAAIGDYGYAGPAERDVANLVKSWNPDFILTLGDNNYDFGDSTTIDQNIGQYYHAYIYKYRGHYGPSGSSARFFPALGNHDYYTRNGEAYRDYFTLPGNGRYYDFVWGDVHFFALDSDPAEPDGIKATSVQGQWLRARLAASTARWKVVYLHHAPYSSGQHGSTAALQWPFQEWGASVVLAGHDHHYERLLVAGFPYLVNGLGGRSRYTLPAAGPLPQSQVEYAADYGALLVDATPDSLTFRFFTRAKRLVDEYTLRRPLAPEPHLYPLSPNPIGEATTVEYSLPSATLVQVRVLNALGQQVLELAQGVQPAGWHRLAWPRAGLPPGLYYVQLLGPGFAQAVRAVAQ